MLNFLKDATCVSQNEALAHQKDVSYRPITASKLDSSKSSVASLCAQLQDLEAQVSDEEIHLSKVKLTLNTLKNSNDQFENTINERKQQVEQAKTFVENLYITITKSQSTMDKTKMLLQQVEQSDKELITSKSNDTAEINRSLTEFQQLVDEIDALNAQITNIPDQSNIISEQNNLLEAEKTDLARLSSEYDKIDLKTVNSQLDECNEHYKSLNNEHSTQQQQQIALESEVQSQEDLIKQLKASIVSYNSQHMESLTKYNSLTTRKRTIQQQIVYPPTNEIDTSIIASLKDNIVASQQRIHNSNGEIRSIQQNIQNITQSITLADSQRSTEATSLHENDFTLQALQSRNFRAQNQLSQVRSELMSLTSELETEHSTTERCQQDLLDQERAGEQSLAQAQAELRKAQAELKKPAPKKVPAKPKKLQPEETSPKYNATRAFRL